MVDNKTMKEYLKKGYIFASDINTKQFLILKTSERQKLDTEFNNTYRKYLEKKYNKIFNL